MLAKPIGPVTLILLILLCVLLWQGPGDIPRGGEGFVLGVLGGVMTLTAVSHYRGW
jgi:hypothetical protein